MISRRLASGLLALSCSLLAQAAPVSLTEADARHLLMRTGFAPDRGEVRAITGQSATRAVADIIERARKARAAHPAPDFVGMPPPIPQALLKTREEQQAMRLQQNREGLEIKSWWVREMIESPAPLSERMVLFWHNRFATSQDKVVRSQAMWVQHQLFRAHALGNFRVLLHAVAKDPAMLVYLDGANSRKEAPNENFAREVMELFTLGEASQGGGYSEQDIREAARAFTGWSIERDDFSFRWRPAFHDTGAKTLFGRTGAFDGDQALDLILAQAAAPRHLVNGLWREFVSPQPDPREVERIAQLLRSADFDVSVALRALLLSDAFWAESNRGSLIKSPLDLVVGTVRQFGFRFTDVTPFVLKSAQLGQNLLAPPNVKGWPGQDDWINATTLLERKRFTEQLFRSVEIRGEDRSRPIEMGPAGRFEGNVMGPDERGTPQQMQALFNATFGAGTAGNRRILGLLGREGVIRVAQGMSRVSFDPEQWLAQYGGAADREPDPQVQARIAQAVLAVAATRDAAPGTVGVARLRALTLDPAYQLK